MQADSDHYATLGLDRRCNPARIRAAYRLLARRHHPDANPESHEGDARIRELNAAYETLSDPARRRAYDRELDAAPGPAAGGQSGVKIARDLSHDVRLRIEDFLRGVSLEVRVNDPGNSRGVETFPLVISPGTAPGARFRLPRDAPFEGGFVDIRVRALPSFRFKLRGSDLRCDLRINCRRAAAGGTELVTGPGGAPLRVQIPAGIARGEIVRLPGEGMPKPRGGRGDLLVRIAYRPEVRISRAAGASSKEPQRRG